MKHFIRTTTGALVAAALAAGCSSTPSQSDTATANAALGNAGHAIDQASSDPHVAQYASSELGRAQDSLHKAQSAWNEKHDLTTTTHLAYLAQQRAATAQELANERAAHEAVRVAALERDHTLQVAGASRRGEAGAVVTTAQGQVALTGFATGKADVPSGTMPKLDELAAMLKANPDRKVVIEGHTDNVGSPGYNMTLAMERAQAVRVALYRRGIDPGRVVVRSSGEGNPIASNDTRAGRRENRRAEVIIAEPEAQVARSSQPAPGVSATGQSGTRGQTGQGGQNEQMQQNQQMQQKQQMQQMQQDQQMQRDQQKQQMQQDQQNQQEPPNEPNGN